MGRPPKPTALKELQGNPGKRKLSRDEPRLTLKAPPCPFPKEPKVATPPGATPKPPTLMDLARREWFRNVRILMMMRVLTEADAVELQNMCMHQAIALDAMRQMNKSSALSRIGSAYVQQNPLLAIIRSHTALVTKAATNFGLHPSGRVRLHQLPTGDSDTGNKWARFEKPGQRPAPTATKPN